MAVTFQRSSYYSSNPPIPLLLNFEGLVHVFFGVMFARASVYRAMSQFFYDNLTTGAGQVDIKEDSLNVPDKAWPHNVLRVLLQHGLNLTWIGLVACIVPLTLMKDGNPACLWLYLMVFFFDACYWVAIDVYDYAAAFPGKLMTYIQNVGMIMAALDLQDRKIIGQDDMGLDYWEHYPKAFISIASIFMGIGAIYEIACLINGGAFYKSPEIQKIN